ncbi:hypothetical protein RHGRI_034079 [Rhododendron griersonianum]|uniref:Uncharacterized protein n=1 Tax=Rhododendron griersonianum TaxID=479676 RepID=A0AAV6HZN2_9ERIC|nr:hypothetical protein RHGRI_034079 [Rhododendron griersonianum]
MGDGSISMADGLGFVAVDSNELRRKQKSLRSPSSNFSIKPFDLRSGSLPPFNPSTNPLHPGDFKNTNPSPRSQLAFGDESVAETGKVQQISSVNPKIEHSDDEDELSEVLESVVSSKQEPETLSNIPAFTYVGTGVSLSPVVEGVLVHSGLKLPEPPDSIDFVGIGRAAGKVPIGGLVSNISLSKSAQKRLSKQATLGWVRRFRRFQYCS